MADPGVVTGLDVERTKERLFVIEGGHPNPNWRDDLLGALPVLSGKTQVFLMLADTSFSEEAVERWQGGAFSSFEVTISHTFLRGRRFRAGLSTNASD